MKSKNNLSDKFVGGKKAVRGQLPPCTFLATYLASRAHNYSRMQETFGSRGFIPDPAEELMCLMEMGACCTSPKYHICTQGFGPSFNP